MSATGSYIHIFPTESMFLFFSLAECGWSRGRTHSPPCHLIISTF